MWIGLGVSDERINAFIQNNYIKQKSAHNNESTKVHKRQRARRPRQN